MPLCLGEVTPLLPALVQLETVTYRAAAPCGKSTLPSTTFHCSRCHGDERRQKTICPHAGDHDTTSMCKGDVRGLRLALKSARCVCCIVTAFRFSFCCFHNNLYVMRTCLDKDPRNLFTASDDVIKIAHCLPASHHH